MRPAIEDDLPFLHALYATTRAEELAGVPWPETARARFLDSQFSLQHQDFVTRHVAGDFWTVEQKNRPIGRLYVDRTRAIWRLVDIALLPERRSGGTGTALLRWLQRTARSAGADGIDLHVFAANVGAARLYARSGFVDAMSVVSTHRRMIWSAPVS